LTGQLDRDGGSVVNDLHVHTQFSYDAPEGSMERSCRRALEIGLPAIAFTEHADHVADAEPFDVERYAESVERCRATFPGLTILSGVELGEPHRFRAESDALLAGYPFDLVLGSCHSILLDDRLVWIGTDETLHPDVAHASVRSFFRETLALVEDAPIFASLTHLDYPKRYWPHDALAYREEEFEEEYRAVLAAAAAADIALEINTEPTSSRYGPCPGARVVRWWREAGGRALSFGSDAHRPDDVASGLELAAAIARAEGFRDARHGLGFWRR
jgi:histidinol-phosphatase (PHP family)